MNRKNCCLFPLLIILLFTLSGCGSDRSGSSTPESGNPPRQQTEEPPQQAESEKAEPSPYKAIVDINYTGTDGEVIDGVKRYKSIRNAVNDAPLNGTETYAIFIKKGHL
jgi:hypothetical protein